MTGRDVDARAFRMAAGQFMTGVTIVTTLDEAGRPAGLTVNSFTSVSLHPPMLLFCLGNDSASFDAFTARNGFVVHVLSAQQQDLAQRFATKGIDRFAGVDWTAGCDGLPVIPDALATFECRHAAVVEGGDHLLHLGEVLALRLGDVESDALGYFRGRYVNSQGLDPP